MSDSESGKVERTKMRYPKGRMVVVRDSTVPISLNNNPGAVLLSTLLFWYDNPWKLDTYDEKEQTFTMCRTQAAIEEQACHQIDVKTIHDTAVPLLQLLGYLTVKEKMNGNIYILHMDRIFAAYAAYEQGTEKLKSYLKASLQLESALIKMNDAELESALINKRGLYLQLERVLIVTRADSNCKRGRKPKPQETSEAISEDTENIREYRENNNREESTGEQSDTATSAPSLPLDALTPSLPSDTHSQQQEIARICDTCGRPQTLADCPWCMTTRLPAIPKTPSLPSAVEPGRSGGPTPGAPAPLPGGTSHEQNRDASPRNEAGFESDLGAVTSAPIPPVLPEVFPPRTMRATVVSPPPQVLVVSQQFTSVEDWKQAQESFVEQLRGIWKTASPDFKRQSGNWNAYRKQYLDRWLKANPQPTAESLLSPEERRIWQDWQTNYKRPIPLTASDRQALVMLLPISPTREELKAERGWLFSTDDPKKPWYRKIGVSLLDCAKNWSKWQSLQEPERGEKPATRTLTREELRRMPV